MVSRVGVSGFRAWGVGFKGFVRLRTPKPETQDSLGFRVYGLTKAINVPVAP